MNGQGKRRDQPRREDRGLEVSRIPQHSARKAARRSATTGNLGRENQQSWLKTSEMHYHCRGCGKPLPPDSDALFHDECLRADKRRRTQAKRLAEREKFDRWLSRLSCPKCGAKLERVTRSTSLRPSEDGVREASQRGSERRSSRGAGLDTPGPSVGYSGAMGAAPTKRASAGPKGSFRSRLV